MSQDKSLQTQLSREVLDLASLTSKIVESFKTLRSPIVESQKRVPKATAQLDKISEQTEAATHQMLDVVEAITQREQDVADDLKKLRQIAVDGKTEGALELIEHASELVSANCNDTYAIMDALQFQDITSQQMDHAASLLEEIETKLMGIIRVLGGHPAQEDDSSGVTKKKKRIFDPHAHLFEKKTEQEVIDTMFSEKK